MCRAARLFICNRHPPFTQQPKERHVDMTLQNEPNSFQPARGRDVAALQDPRPAAIIGARDAAGNIGFATVIWITPISHSPAMVAFALREKSYTMGIIRETGLFSISVPPADEQGVLLIEFCGKNTGHATAKGALVEHRLMSAAPADGANDAQLGADVAAQDPAFNPGTAASNTKASPEDALVPVPAHCYSWEVGTVSSIQQAGDHLLVIGTITHAETRAPRDERGQLVPAGSLLCVQHGHYATCEPLE